MSDCSCSDCAQSLTTTVSCDCSECRAEAEDEIIGATVRRVLLSERVNAGNVGGAGVGIIGDGLRKKRLVKERRVGLFEGFCPISWVDFTDYEMDIYEIDMNS